MHLICFVFVILTGLIHIREKMISKRICLWSFLGCPAVVKDSQAPE